MPLESSQENEPNVSESVETDGSVPDGNAAESSPAETTDTDVEKTLLDRVSDALEGPEDSSASEMGSKDSKADSADKEGADEASAVSLEPTEEEREKGAPKIGEDGTKRYPGTKEGRVLQLWEARKEALDQVETLKPKAENYDKLAGYMREHDISPEDVDNALEITRLMKSGQYEQALQAITPLYRDLAVKAGQVLPDDLQEKVNLGHVTEDVAREMHQNRVRAENAESREQQARERQAQQDEQQKRAKHVEHVVDVTTRWNTQKAKNDPDWLLKRQAVADQVELEISRRMQSRGWAGYPQTDEEIADLLESALTKVESQGKHFAPKPKENNPPASQHVSSRSTTKPTNVMEALEQGLAMANG